MKNYLKNEYEKQINQKYKNIEDMKTNQKNQKCDENLIFKEYKDPTHSLRRKIRIEVDKENQHLLNMRNKGNTLINNSFN